MYVFFSARRAMKFPRTTHASPFFLVNLARPLPHFIEKAIVS